jgi:hypothetical protein
MVAHRSKDMTLPYDHWKPDGTCSCPMDGICCECGKPCNDHDLVGDFWWCAECIDRHLDEDAERLKGRE